MCVCPLSASIRLWHKVLVCTDFLVLVRCWFIHFVFHCGDTLSFRSRRGYKCSPFRDDGKDCSIGSKGSAFIRYRSELRYREPKPLYAAYGERGRLRTDSAEGIAAGLGAVLFKG